MRRLSIVAGVLLACDFAFAQVDVDSRRIIQFQAGLSGPEIQDRRTPLGYFWFNKNDFPWTGSALRVIYAGTFVDSEFSRFLPSQPKTAFGGGLGGGFPFDFVTPYANGERLPSQQIDIDGLAGRVFVNHEFASLRLGDRGSLPLNGRVTFGLSRALYRPSRTTSGFVLPADSSTQTLLGELRLGGIEPGLASRRGLELYLSAEESFRSDARPFGPVGGLYPAQDDYRRFLVSLAGKIPIRQTTVFARFSGGLGRNIDELSAWKVGGNIVGVEAYLYPLHGYYTQEFLAEEFGIGNLEWSHLFGGGHHFAFHVYGDYAEMKLVPPNDPGWRRCLGLGVGTSFRGPGRFDWLLSYGYGADAIRNGRRGGHEAALALETAF